MKTERKTEREKQSQNKPTRTHRAEERKRYRTNRKNRSDNNTQEARTEGIQKDKNTINIFTEITKQIHDEQIEEGKNDIKTYRTNNTEHLQKEITTDS